MNKELKPCPFCGEDAEIMTTRSNITAYESYDITCINGCCSTGRNEDIEGLIEAWNTREATEKLIVQKVLDLIVEYESESEGNASIEDYYNAIKMLIIKENVKLVLK